MSLGRTVASIEIIAAVWGALKLAGLLGTFRWDNKIAKLLFYFAVTVRIGIGIFNLRWAKFSDTGLILFSLYLLLVILVFYHTDIVKTIIVYLLYCYSLMMFQIAYLFVICYMYSITLNEYINEKSGILYSYYNIHIICICVEMAGVCLFIRLIKNKKLLENYNVWFYVGCIVIIVCELLIDSFLLSKSIMLKKIDSYILCLTLFIIWFLASISCISISIYKYIQIKYQQSKTDINMKLLSEQYEFMVQSYEDKRCQVHDILQHDIMLLGMLENHQYEKAVTYLKERLRKGKKGQNRYTGLTTVDIMLSHKISTAERYHIRFHVVADIYEYPLKDNDLCILMGNLLDNSIEAVKELPEEQREIEIILKSPNKIFMMEITNPYVGKLKKKNEHYLTTKKENQQMHGIGLYSVEKIVMAYKGDIEIRDYGKVFKVIITIY